MVPDHLDSSSVGDPAYSWAQFIFRLTQYLHIETIGADIRYLKSDESFDFAILLYRSIMGTLFMMVGLSLMSLINRFTETNRYWGRKLTVNFQVRVVGLGFQIRILGFEVYILRFRVCIKGRVQRTVMPLHCPNLSNPAPVRRTTDTGSNVIPDVGLDTWS